MGLGLVAVVLSAVLPPVFIEQYYSRGLYVLIRKVLSGAFGWLPFAGVCILFFAVLIFFVKWIFSVATKRGRWQRKAVEAAGSLLALAGGIVFFFQLMWGFNYGRMPLEKQLGLEVKPLDVNDLRDELLLSIAAMEHFRSLLDEAGEAALNQSHLPDAPEMEVRQMLKLFLEQELNYPAGTRVRVRQLYPKGVLLHIGTAGVYVPFTGEGHVDAGLHPLQLPFVLAHEMAHGYGIGGEGDCNFLAFLACTRSADPFLKYVGHLNFFRYVAPAFRAWRPDEYRNIWQNLPKGIKNDLRAIREQMDKYPDIFPALRDAAYNSYLKAQGIDDGIRNYDRVTVLVHAWRKLMENG